MIKIVLIGFVCVLGLVQGQRRTSEPRPPLPPPGYNADGSAIQETAAVPCSGKSCSAVPIFPFSYKWVHCNGKWIKVTKKTCPAVFVDPDFSEHQCFCSTAGDLYGYYPGTSIFLFDPPTPPVFKYCAHMPECFCNACAKKKPFAVSSSASIVDSKF